MINLFVTYKCNLDCSYCFAHELLSDFPGHMSRETFDKVLPWLTKSSMPAVAFIGGEPTLHPWLAEMMEAVLSSGISPVLFTNGLFSPDLADRLAPLVSNFVVNYNDPAVYTPGQSKLLHRNLDRLSRLGARLTFSKNFTPAYRDYGYLLEGAERYGVRHVRYDISRPSNKGGNDHVSLDGAREMMDHIVSFVLQCETRGIRTGLDCCLRLCDLSEANRRYLERVSMKFTGICHPSVDVHPDLSASYCLPLRHVSVPDVTAFANADRLMQHFSEMVHPMRYENAGEECKSCPDFKRHCQGGCLALKQTGHAPLKPQETDQEVDHERV